MEVRQYNNYKEIKIMLSLPTLGEEPTAKSLLTTDDITIFEESSYTLKREAKV